MLCIAVAGLAVTATVGVWPAIAQSSPPHTPLDSVRDLSRLGIGLDGLLAAGLSVSEAQGVVNWVAAERARFQSIASAQSQARTARTVVENIRAKMVRTGRTEELDEQYGLAEAQLSTAEANVESLVAAAHTALGTYLTEAPTGGEHWPLVQRVIANRDRLAPAPYKTLDLTSSQWDQLERYLALIDRHPEGLDAQTRQLGDSIAVDPNFVAAKQRVSLYLQTLMQSVLGG